MGTSRKCALIVKFTVSKGYWTPSEWVTRTKFSYPGFGKPTGENLTKYIKACEASTLKGGSNEQIGPTTILKAVRPRARFSPRTRPRRSLQ